LLFFAAIAPSDITVITTTNRIGISSPENSGTIEVEEEEVEVGLEDRFCFID